MPDLVRYNSPCPESQHEELGGTLLVYNGDNLAPIKNRVWKRVGGVIGFPLSHLELVSVEEPQRVDGLGVEVRILFAFRVPFCGPRSLTYLWTVTHSYCYYQL